jgi:Zinc finger, ZZ type
MFVKFKRENSDQVAKIKYEGQDLVKMKELAAGKLSFVGEFDFYYLDDENEKILLAEESDWVLCLESQKAGANNSSASKNLILFLAPATSQIAQVKPSPTGSIPHNIMAGGCYQFDEKSISHCAILPISKPTGVTITSSVVNYIPSETPANPLTSSLYGGVQAKPQGSSSVVHSNIICDACRKGPLEGIRYKSIIDNDFDLCEKCVLLDAYKFHPFIRIPYASDVENKGVWSAKEFTTVIKHFKGKLSAPEDPLAKEITDMLMKAFPSSSRESLAAFVRKHHGKDYAAVYAEYVKTHYSR